MGFLVEAGLSVFAKGEKKVSGYDYGLLKKSDFEIVRKYDHFNRDVFEKLGKDQPKAGASQFVIRIPDDHALTSSGKQQHLEYFINGKWVDKIAALQSILPASIPADQLMDLERWVEHYDKDALARLKPMSGEWLQKGKAWLDANTKQEKGMYVLLHGDREKRHEKLQTITFKYLTSTTPKKSIARNFGAPIGNHGKPVGNGNIHAFLVPEKAIFFIPAVWKKYSKVINQFSREAEVLVKPGKYEMTLLR